MTYDEQRSRVVNPAQASTASLLVAFLLFALAAAGFVVVNQYWPAVQTVVPSTDLGGGKPSE